MPLQAAGMALVASLYPLGLAMVLLLATAGRPRAKAMIFLAGAAACTLAVGFVVVFALHGAGLAQHSQRTPRYGLRLALGLALVIAAVVVTRLPRRAGGASRWSRRAREGGLIMVFLVGLALYLPSPAYLSALERVGSARLPAAALAGWVVLMTALVLITIEVPIALFLLAPEWTIPKLRAVDAWLGRHARTLAAAVLAVLGVWQAAEGLAGLLSLSGWRCHPGQR